MLALDWVFWNVFHMPKNMGLCYSIHLKKTGFDLNTRYNKLMISWPKIKGWPIHKINIFIHSYYFITSFSLSSYCFLSQIFRLIHTSTNKGYMDVFHDLSIYIYIYIWSLGFYSISQGNRVTWQHPSPFHICRILVSSSRVASKNFLSNLVEK